jgi:hypothetical protein
MKPAPQRNAQASISTHAPSTNFKRRRFLLALSAGSASAAATAAAAPIAAQVVAATPADESAQGYRETEHIRSYYASTRL